MLPEEDTERVRDYCQSRVPDHVLDQLRVEMDIERLALTILECRPPWRDDLGPAWTRQPVARLRYVKKTGLWTLYSSDRHGAWHRYPFVPPDRTVVPLLEEVERDPTCIFLGLVGAGRGSRGTGCPILRLGDPGPLDAGDRGVDG